VSLLKTSLSYSPAPVDGDGETDGLVPGFDGGNELAVDEDEADGEGDDDSAGGEDEADGKGDDDSAGGEDEADGEGDDDSAGGEDEADSEGDGDRLANPGGLLGSGGEYCSYQAQLLMNVNAIS
jgi:cobalamin biosynthesis protein CobT